MKVIIIAGFLGSGKTTLLLQMAKSFSAASKKTAVIENELGEFGVDGDYLELEGLQVKQLLGGCICCTLSSGLVETLENLNRNYSSDIIILEATGAANPGDIVANLGLCRIPIHSIKVITLVDAKRYEMLMKMMTPLLTSQILTADIVIISKIDSVETKIVEHIIHDISIINNYGYIHAASLEKGKMTDLNLIMERVEC
jgi:G3E family GTPase